MDGGAWWAAVHGVATSQTQLSDLTFTFHFHAMEKEMATHSSVLAWRIPGTAEPGGLLSMGLHRVGHDCSNLAAAQNKAGQRLTVLPREHTGHSKPPSNNTRDNSMYEHHQMVNTKIRLIMFFAAKDGEALYSQQNQDWELTVVQIMNSLLPNSDLT